MRVQAFLAESPIERLVLRVIGWLAGTREVDLYAVLVCPLVECLGDEFAAVVGLDVAW